MADPAATCQNCASTDVIVQDLIWGTVGTTAITRTQSGEIKYEPNGYTEILWDCVEREVLYCRSCGHDEVIDQCEAAVEIRKEDE